MSGKRAAVPQKAQAAVSATAQSATAQSATAQSATARATVNRSDASARWAALDSRHERLVTASDAVLAELDRGDGRRMAS
jgi:hypothetical protein